MLLRLSALILAATLFSGCATVPMADEAASTRAKAFSSPSDGTAGLYVYRSGSFGGALKKEIRINGECIGKSAPNVFFYEEVDGGTEHKISTQSELGLNDLMLQTEPGQNYYIRQSIKMGLIVGGSKLKLVDADEGKEAISKLSLATRSSCG